MCNKNDYNFDEQLTKWGDIQWSVQRLVALCIEDDAMEGCEAKDFKDTLYAYAKLFFVLEDLEEKFIINKTK